MNPNTDPKTANCPIYAVIAERQQGLLGQSFSIWNIVRVIACDLSDLDGIWTNIINPANYNGRNLQCHVFTREIDNPFAALAKALSDPEVAL